jgi:hypothetical protein
MLRKKYRLSMIEPIKTQTVRRTSMLQTKLTARLVRLSLAGIVDVVGRDSAIESGDDRLYKGVAQHLA